MTGLRILGSLNNLPDEMIAEAIFAAKHRKVRIRWWYIPVAACLSLCLLCSVVWLLPQGNLGQQHDTERAIMLEEEELHASAYGAFCPDYTALGCVLDQAGIYAGTHFNAVFHSAEGKISVNVAPMTALHDVFQKNYEDRLIDLETVEHNDQKPLEYPVFLEEQFSERCWEYIRITDTAAGYKHVQFAVVTQEYMIVYSFDTVNTENSDQWITAVFESICRCYTTHD